MDPKSGLKHMFWKSLKIFKLKKLVWVRVELMRDTRSWLQSEENTRSNELLKNQMLAWSWLKQDRKSHNLVMFYPSLVFIQILLLNHLYKASYTRFFQRLRGLMQSLWEKNPCLLPLSLNEKSMLVYHP